MWPKQKRFGMEVLEGATARLHNPPYTSGKGFGKRDVRLEKFPTAVCSRTSVESSYQAPLKGHIGFLPFFDLRERTGIKKNTAVYYTPKVALLSKTTVLLAFADPVVAGTLQSCRQLHKKS